MKTTTLFDQYYSALPLSKKHLEAGNKIIMLASAFEQLTSRSMKVVYPMLFRITSYATRSHCGVVEFTADEGSVLLPTRMMKNMKIQEGDLVNIRNITLPKGTYIKIQPHATKFFNLSNPKSLLEVAFRDCACLTTGDTIEINQANHKYLIDVLETKPSLAILMFDTDCEVDFAQPLDYKEPDQKKTSVLGKRERTMLADEDRKSRPTHDEESKLFPGEGRRLGRGTTTVTTGVNIFDQSMKKLKITEVATTKEVDGKPKSKQGSAEFKPFSGKAKRLDGQPLVAVVAKDVEHDQSNARSKSMKKLKITEVATTKEVDGKPKSKQGSAEFKPFSGKAKRLDGQPLVAVVAKDVEHDQSNARSKVKKEEYQGFKAFTGKSFRLM
nr:ubiquitin fusion degradation protein 1 homolog [Tanacetum cinerariifolium]